MTLPVTTVARLTFTRSSGTLWIATALPRHYEAKLLSGYGNGWTARYYTSPGVYTTVGVYKTLKYAMNALDALVLQHAFVLVLGAGQTYYIPGSSFAYITPAHKSAVRIGKYTDGSVGGWIYSS